MKKIKLLIKTIQYLKVKQVIYQVYYRLFRKYIFTYFSSKKYVTTSVSCQFNFILSEKDFSERLEFDFMNRSQKFANGMDWNYHKFGKLWCYKLNYFNYINNPQVDSSYASNLIADYCTQIRNLKDGLEPYPISLRGINWIKFFIRNGVKDQNFDSSLYLQYHLLFYQIEYHLLGNHLLENGCALLFGAYYFRDKNFYKKAERILIGEIKEQILNDGAHFEKSPMYHCILLTRLLDCYNIVICNKWEISRIETLIKNTIIKMLGWINEISFKNGDIPMVNDSVVSEFHSLSQINEYASRLGLKPNKIILNESGYRKKSNENFELLMDIGNIGPDYIPGHAHSDTFNFLLYVKGYPVIVEAGTSTYEISEQRITERSTLSHNTVVINEQEQSDMWASFRVGRRAKILSTEQGSQFITAVHDGYKHLNLFHRRQWIWDNKTIYINDIITGKGKIDSCKAFFHFHPDTKIHSKDNVIKNAFLTLSFNGAIRISIETYQYANGFNRLSEGQVAIVEFTRSLESILVVL